MLTFDPAHFRADTRRTVSVATRGRLAALVTLAAGFSNNPHPPGETARPVFSLVLGDDPRTLDPTVAYTVSEAHIVDVIYPAHL